MESCCMEESSDPSGLRFSNTVRKSSPPRRLSFFRSAKEDARVATADEDRHVLATAGTWRATPGNYSSLRALWLHADGSGDLIYGYGQTIYAFIKCRWEVVSAGLLRLTYLASPPCQRFAGFSPPDDARVRELGYTLTAGRVAGVEDIVPNPYEFDRTLELSEPPWPAGLNLPYEVPRVFYGRVTKASAQDVERSAAADHRDT